jgi:dTDP-L-rhamnose 4-epimerase
MKNILITGGAGFIGSNLTIKLIENGYNVTVLDNLSEQIHGRDAENTSPLFLNIKNKVNFLKGSIVDRKLLSDALRNQDVVIHLAAETGTGQSMYNIENYTQVNVGGTALLLDILANGKNKYAVKKLIVASSRSVYGEGRYFSEEFGMVYPDHRVAPDMDAGDFEVHCPGISKALQLVATDEESKIHPSSVYGITKQNQEQMVMTVCPTIGIAPVAFRYQNVYGPGQSLSNPYTGILSIFSTLIKNGKDINIFEDGNESRDFVYIDDAVSATIAGIEKDAAHNEIFNVGSGVPVSVLTVAKALMSLYNSSSKINISGYYRLGDIRHNYADLKKIKSRLSFEPTVYFNEGIKLFTDWVNSQAVVEDKYEQSIKEMTEKGLINKSYA